MIRYVLDTNVLIDILRDRPHGIRERIQEIGIDNCVVSDITVYELYTGVAASAAPERNKDLLERMFDKLAVILAAREMASNTSACQNITNSAFKVKTEQIRSSASFTALASQYQKDPAMRSRINNGLANGDGGKALEQEYQKINAPQKEKTVEAPVLKNTE